MRQSVQNPRPCSEIFPRNFSISSGSFSSMGSIILTGWSIGFTNELYARLHGRIKAAGVPSRAGQSSPGCGGGRRGGKGGGLRRRHQRVGGGGGGGKRLGK